MLDRCGQGRDIATTCHRYHTITGSDAALCGKATDGNDWSHVNRSALKCPPPVNIIKNIVESPPLHTPRMQSPTKPGTQSSAVHKP